jgi:diaminopimelate decarboxylase
MESGELLAILSYGAYGYSMASNYNGQLRPPEVLVDGSTWRLIRRRETIEDLFRTLKVEQ